MYKENRLNAFFKEYSGFPHSLLHLLVADQQLGQQLLHLVQLLVVPHQQLLGQQQRVRRLRQNLQAGVNTFVELFS